jgi:hypothetical protein
MIIAVIVNEIIKRIYLHEIREGLTEKHFCGDQQKSSGENGFRKAPDYLAW